MREFFAYRIQKRNSGSSLLIYNWKLFQKFLVDAYSMRESSRLNFIRHNQEQLRVDMSKGLHDRILSGDIDLEYAYYLLVCILFCQDHSLEVLDTCLTILLTHSKYATGLVFFPYL